MKRLLQLCALVIFGVSLAKAQAPDCVRYFMFDATGSTAYLDNRQAGCTEWTLGYQSTGFSALSLAFQSASGALTPGSFSAYTGTTDLGANPNTNTTGAYSTFTGYVGWVRVTLSSKTGTGNIVGVLYGYKSGYASGGGTPAEPQLHVITLAATNNGSVLATGALSVFGTADFVCTINRVDISADQSGSVTVDIWKQNAAIPSSGNKISASAPVTLSSTQLSQSGSLTGWTTDVSVNDVFGGTIASVATITSFTIQIWCQS